MIPYQFIWLIMLLPLFSFIINGLLIRPFVNRKSKVYGYITILAITASAALSIWALTSLMSVESHEILVPDVSWVVIGNGVSIHLGLIADQLSIIMAVTVSIVSLMVQIYSLGYMHSDEAGYYRYYTYMSLFTFSMLGLVLSDNLLFTFVFWEMVGGWLPLAHRLLVPPEARRRCRQESLYRYQNRRLRFPGGDFNTLFQY